MAGSNDGVVMAYAAGELRRGASEQQTAADAADGLARVLAGLRLDPAALGTVRSAAVFAQAVGIAVRSQAGGAAGEALRRARIGQRSSAAAVMGAGLTTDSAQVAQSASPAGPPR